MGQHWKWEIIADFLPIADAYKLSTILSRHEPLVGQKYLLRRTARDVSAEDSVKNVVKYLRAIPIQIFPLAVRAALDRQYPIPAKRNAHKNIRLTALFCGLLAEWNAEIGDNMARMNARHKLFMLCTWQLFATRWYRPEKIGLDIWKMLLPDLESDDAEDYEDHFLHMVVCNSMRIDAATVWAVILFGFERFRLESRAPIVQKICRTARNWGRAGLPARFVGGICGRPRRPLVDMMIF